MSRRRNTETTTDPPTDPLFPMARTPATRSGETSKRIRPIGWARCPECITHARIAVLLTGTHATYREHHYPTWSGARMTCRASGVALCVLPPRPWPAHPENAVHACPHGPITERNTGAPTSAH